MSNDQQHPDMRHLWQGQVAEGTSMPSDEVRNALARLNRVERRRTWVGGLFCLLFLGACGVLLILAAPIPIVRDVEFVFALGAGFFFFQVIQGLRRAPGQLSSQGEPQACAAFYRSVLERQRKFSRRAALWAPLLISVTLLPVILWIPPLRVIMIALWVVLVLFWVYESLETARRSQRELDKLNASWR
jgi:hypothetical protein